MSEPPNSEQEPQQPITEAIFQQNAEGAQGTVRQQGIIGDNNSQYQNLEEKVNPETAVNNSDDQSDNFQGKVYQQEISGNRNNQNQNITQTIINLGLDQSGVTLNQPSQSQEDSFVDPTEELPPRSNKLPAFESDLLQDWYQKLLEDNLIFISCVDQSISLAAAHALAEKVGIPNKRLLTAQRKTLRNFEEINDELIQLSIDIILRPEIGEGKPTLIIVDTGNLQTFFDSLVVRLSTAEAIKNQLKNSQKLCICLVEPEILSTTLQINQVQLFFQCWKIPLQTNEFETKVIRDLEQVDIISLFKNGNSLIKTVLYVASSFPKLNFSEFEALLLILIQNNSKPEETSNFKADVIDKTLDSGQAISLTIGGQKITIDASPDNLDFSNLIKKDTTSENLIIKVWNDDPDEILNSCYLKYLKGDFNSRVIDFSIPLFTQKLAEYFQDEGYAYYRKQFKKIIELNLLFDTSRQAKKSRQFRKNLVKLSVSMMLSSPNEYGSDWLNDKIVDAVAQFNEIKTGKISDYIFICITDLFREILNHPELEGLVDNSLDSLISLKQHSIVLAIVKRLRFAPQFNEIYWMKQLIQRGDEEVRSQTYKDLCNQLKRSDSRIYDILEEIQKWLPDLERHPKGYSLLHKYALKILPEYILETLKTFPSKLYGEEALSYPLFASLRDEEYAQNKLDMIVAWLLHPGMMSLYIDDVLILKLVIEGIIPKLFTVLYGLENNFIYINETIANTLLNSIAKTIKYYEASIQVEYNIIKKWNNLTDYYLEECKRSRISKHWELDNLFNAQRNVVICLIEQLSGLLN
jgi:hypothetical protein